MNGKRVDVAMDTTNTKKSLRSLPFEKNGTIEGMLLRTKVQQEKRKKIFGKSYNHAYDDYVYVRENGDRYRVDWVTTSFNKFLKKNGVRVIRFHDLCHSCARNCMSCGSPFMGENVSSRKSSSCQVVP